MEREYQGRRQAEPVQRERREQSTNRRRRKPKRRRLGGLLVVTVFLIAITTAVMFAGIFGYYVKYTLGWMIAEMRFRINLIPSAISTPLSTVFQD